MTRQCDIDCRLLSRCAEGDVLALKQLYLMHSGRLYLIAFQTLKQKQLAESILQESFIEVWERSKQLPANKKNIIKWMAKIVRCNALRRLRRNERYRKEFERIATEDKDFASVALRAW